VICELNDIRIVPGLVKNIISINQLKSEGWKIEEGDGGGFNLTRNGQVLKFKRVTKIIFIAFIPILLKSILYRNWKMQGLSRNLITKRMINGATMG